jgi:hypothetical protein
MTLQRIVIVIVVLNNYLQGTNKVLTKEMILETYGMHAVYEFSFLNKKKNCVNKFPDTIIRDEVLLTFVKMFIFLLPQGTNGELNFFACVVERWEII